MKISLLSLPSPFLIDDLVFPSLGVLYIESFLRARGVVTEFIDLSLAKNADYKACPDYLVVGISMTTPQVNIAREVAKDLKRIGHIVIAGGCGVASLTASDNELFDYVIHGEGEVQIYNLLATLYNKNHSISQVGINNYEFPDRRLVERYNYMIDGKHTTTMITSRGCPFGCKFCVDGTNKSVRIRSTHNVNKEIDYIHAMGYEGIMFFDDIFTCKESRIQEIGSHIKELGMVYRCFTHVKYAPKMAKALAETNCAEVGIGIESGDDAMLERIRKGNTVADSYEAIQALRDAGLRVKGFFMIGLPGETESSVEKTKSFIFQSGLDDFDICIYTPYPSTEIYDNISNYDLQLTGDSSFYKGKQGEYESAVRTGNLSELRLIELRDEIESELKGVHCG